MPRYGKPAVASWGPDRLDVFFKSIHGTLIHAWQDGGSEGSHDLGGNLDSDPVAVVRGDGILDVFARSAEQWLLHWSWDPELKRLVARKVLPGYLATNPTVDAVGDTLYVFARSLDGPVRFWESTRDASGNDHWSEPAFLDRSGISSDPTAWGSSVFARGNNDGHLDYYNRVSGEWLDLRGTLTGAPAVASLYPGRTDVYARRPDGQLQHWGTGGLFQGPLHGWWVDEQIFPDPLEADPTVVGRTPEGADLFVRDSTGALMRWSWDGPPPHWTYMGVILVGIESDAAAIERRSMRLDVVARAGDEALWHWWRDGGSEGHRLWQIEASALDPAPQDIRDEDASINPAFLIARAADHALLGFSAPGHHVSQGGLPELVPEGADAALALVFPPQHIAEEVSKPGAPPLTSAAGLPVWQAQLSGPSHVAFHATLGAAIPLTSEGVLGALDGGRAIGDPGRTGIELPYGLMTTPREQQTGAGAVARHPAAPIESDGTTGLWRMRLGTGAGEGGLALASPSVVRSDPFTLALTQANRRHITLQPSPASAARLELSSLGGTLTATGKWDSFEWDHLAALGRDQYVRTVTKGVLYPLGHRAVFVEVSERTSDEPIAVLRKTRSLYISEPKRQRPVSGGLRHAFPFSEVEITTLEYVNIDPPEEAGWGKIPIPTASFAELEVAAAQAEGPMDNLLEEIHGGDMGYGGGDVLEDKAIELQAAREYMRRYCDVERIRHSIALLQEGGFGEELVEVFFMPHVNGKPIRFPVRCTAANRDVHFDLPLIFVAEIRSPPGPYQNFFSLSDPRVESAVRQAYGTTGSGIVDLAGTPINLTPSSDGTVATSDVQETHRINITGHAWGAGFAPSLGGLNGEDWAAEIALPTMRTLLGADPRAQVKFSDDYLRLGQDDAALRVVPRMGEDRELKYLDIDFSKRSDRSGGLVAPNSVADGISRTKGLVNVAGLTPPAGSQDLDPKKLFSNKATLFGFPLSDLVEGIKAAPEMVTILTDGQPPIVRMAWHNIPLREAAGGAFVPLRPVPSGTVPPQDGTMSVLDLKAESSPVMNESTCTLTHFKLVMPPGESLIEIYFDSVAFTQKTGQPPSLAVKLRDHDPVMMVGKLKLLAVLQKRVGLGGLGPQIEANPAGIIARYAVPVPDVSAFSFVMSNLTFSAALRVPFNGDPVAFALGFASREKPFTLTVLMFGGGGYVDLEVVHTGLSRLEVSLQFGAAVAINIGIGRAEVHAFGGIRYTLAANGGPLLTGFIHIGGSAEILGVISVSIELRVQLEYQFDASRLVGRAKLVIEVDITLFSESVEVDSGDWVIAGGEADRSLPPPGPTISTPARAERTAVEAWSAYREAFA